MMATLATPLWTGLGTFAVTGWPACALGQSGGVGTRDVRGTGAQSTASRGTAAQGAAAQSTTAQATAAQSTDAQGADARGAEIAELKAELARISRRLDALEGSSASPAATASLPSAAPAAEAAKAEETPVLKPEDAPTLALFRGTTLSFAIDGYYGYNFNAPIGRVNLLRAYDVTSNSFNLNQVNLIVEHLPTTQSRFGGRIDLQFGQATETLQGSSVNEQRPQVWRNLFQAYGSYLAPVGTGLQLDFGKFASALGNEGNYTKDQVAYSRAYLYNYLPYYHMGLRANYNLSPKVNVAYWLVNGANDTEDLNNSKSQAFLFTLKPASALTWNVNYYFGAEGRDSGLTLNPGVPTAPTQPGLPTTQLALNLRKEHIFDTYATLQVTKRLALTGEADYVINRNLAHTAPGHTALGEVMAHYTLPQNWSAGMRAEYFDDRGALFSGETQALKETTFVVDHAFAPGFLAKAEYRRDWSNQRFFLSDTPGALLHAQSTATLGLTYWWGSKQGSW